MQGARSHGTAILRDHQRTHNPLKPGHPTPHGKHPAPVRDRAQAARAARRPSQLLPGAAARLEHRQEGARVRQADRPRRPERQREHRRALPGRVRGGRAARAAPGGRAHGVRLARQRRRQACGALP